MSYERWPDDRERAFREIWERFEAPNTTGPARNGSPGTEVFAGKGRPSNSMQSGLMSPCYEAWRMMAYTLMADEHYQEAVRFTNRRIQAFRSTRRSNQDARSRIGYVLALNTFGTAIKEAIEREFLAERWFQENGDEEQLRQSSVRILGMLSPAGTITFRPTNLSAGPAASSRTSRTSRRGQRYGLSAIPVANRPFREPIECTNGRGAISGTQTGRSIRAGR